MHGNENPFSLQAKIFLLIFVKNIRHLKYLLRECFGTSNGKLHFGFIQYIFVVLHISCIASRFVKSHSKFCYLYSNFNIYILNTAVIFLEFKSFTWRKYMCFKPAFVWNTPVFTMCLTNFRSTNENQILQIKCSKEMFWRLIATHFSLDPNSRNTYTNFFLKVKK